MRGGRAHACVLPTRRGGSGRSSVCVTSTLQRKRVARLKTCCFQVAVLLLSLLLLLRCLTPFPMLQDRGESDVEACALSARPHHRPARRNDARRGAGTPPSLQLPPSHAMFTAPDLKTNKHTNNLVSSCTAQLAQPSQRKRRATGSSSGDIGSRQRDQVASRNTRRWRHRGLATTARRAN